MENWTLYTLKREADRLVVVPSSTVVGATVALFGAGCLFMLYLSTMFFRRAGEVSADLWIGGIFVLVAAMVASMSIRAWRSRATPLTIESSGRVGYGERELCAAGTVRAVRIGEARSGEAGDCEIAFELAGGEIVYIPSQYFSISVREHARPFAAKLAEALKVPVTET